MIQNSFWKEIKRHLLGLTMYLLLTVPMYSQETVYIQSIEKGRGILKSRAGECFVIAPLHVISEDDDEIIIRGESRVESRVIFGKGFPSDLVALKIVEGGTQNCKNWKTHEDYKYILDATYKGFLELRNPNGMARIFPVYIKDISDSNLSIRPVDKTESFRKGMSGSSLYTEFNGEKVYLGMLQKIKEGTGYVIQADNIERLTYEFFNPSQDTKSEQSLDNEIQQHLQLLSAKFKSDLEFMEGHFENIQNKNSNQLVRDFSGFLENRKSSYTELSKSESTSDKQRIQYNTTITEMSKLLNKSEKIINKTPNEWDVLALSLIHI